jgi:hypothetical protein
MRLLIRKRSSGPTLTSLLLVAFSLPGTGFGAQQLKHAFSEPPPETRPDVFWQWMGGMISKEGITKDLEAMAAQGVGGVLVMQMPDQAPYPQRWSFRDYPGKVRALSDEWFALVNHAIGETDRLKLTFSIFMSAGWSHVGGPAVTPEKGLKRLKAAQVEVTGPAHFNQVLPRGERLKGSGGGNEIPTWHPDSKRAMPVALEFYRDVAVLAVPSAAKARRSPPGT